MAELTEFAKNLRRIREERGMKQTELAKKLGVSSQTISAYEKGDGSKGKNPALERVIDIANTLDVSLDDLCGRSCKKAMPIKTLGDVARLLCDMWDWYSVTFSERDIRRWADDGESTYNDTTPTIFFDDGPLRRFLEDYTKLQQLQKEKTIDRNMFNDWISLKIRELDNMDIETQRCPF